MSPFDPKKPLFGFTGKFPHAKRRIHLFADERFVYFRPKNAPEDWVGACYLWDVLIEQAKVRDWVEVRRWVASDLRDNWFFRVWNLPDPRPDERRSWHILWRNDFAFVFPSNQSRELDGAFFWPRPAKVSLWKTPTNFLKQHFDSEWNDPQSDVRAALEWCDWTLEKRQNHAVRWERGGEVELRQVVEAALKVAHWDKSQAGCTRLMSACWADGQALKIQFQSEESRDFLRLLKPLLPVFEAQNRSFYDHRSADRRDWRLNLNPDKPPYPQSFGHTIWFEIEPPTQHERLEAALFLREWLQQNAPDLLSDWFPDAA